MDEHFQTIDLDKNREDTVMFREASYAVSYENSDHFFESDGQGLESLRK